MSASHVRQSAATSAGSRARMLRRYSVAALTPARAAPRMNGSGYRRAGGLDSQRSWKRCGTYTSAGGAELASGSEAGGACGSDESGGDEDDRRRLRHHGQTAPLLDRPDPPQPLERAHPRRRRSRPPASDPNEAQECERGPHEAVASRGQAAAAGLKCGVGNDGEIAVGRSTPPHRMAVESRRPTAA